MLKCKSIYGSEDFSPALSIKRLWEKKSLISCKVAFAVCLEWHSILVIRIGIVQAIFRSAYLALIRLSNSQTSFSTRPIKVRIHFRKHTFHTSLHSPHQNIMWHTYALIRIRTTASHMLIQKPALGYEKSHRQRAAGLVSHGADIAATWPV